jgi:hypothetical protein
MENIHNNIDMTHNDKIQMAFDDIIDLGYGYDGFVNKLLENSTPEQYDKGLHIIQDIDNSHITQMMTNVVMTAITNSEAGMI